MDMLLPKSFGGLGLGWQSVMEAGRLSARYCPSTAWIISLVGGHIGMVSRLPAATVRDVLKPNTIIATSTNTRDGRVIERNGSFILQGTWHYCSGVDHADYILVTTPFEGHRTENGLNKYLVLVPKDQVEVIDNWFVTGLSATGSKDILFREYTVRPEQLYFRPDFFDHLDNSPCDFLGTKEVLPITTSLLLGPLLGCLEGGVKHAFPQLGKILSTGGAEKYYVLERMITASNQVNVLQAEYRRIVRYLGERSTISKSLTLEEQFWLIAMKSQFAKSCVRTFQPLVEALGARAIAKSNKVQMYWRDLQVMATHMDVKWTRSLDIADNLLNSKGLDGLFLDHIFLSDAF